VVVKDFFIVRLLSRAGVIHVEHVGPDPGGGVPGVPEPLPCKSHVPVDELFFSTADKVATAQSNHRVRASRARNVKWPPSRICINCCASS